MLMKTRTLARLLLIPMIAAAWVAGVTIASERSASSMANAANKFLGSLTDEQRKQATFATDSEELTRWHYVPAMQFPRNGLPIRAMNETQRGLAHELMKTGLSQRGYTQATTIMVDLENILKVLENGAAMRDPEQYAFSVFGTPAAKGVWGWRVKRPSPVPPFQRRQWIDGGQRSDILWIEPGRGARRWTEEGPSRAWGPRGYGTRAAECAR
jgi:hypothetical protein